jgi:UDP-N-acetylglucosamine 2-epimerase (non-hydrolysing)
LKQNSDFVVIGGNRPEVIKLSELVKSFDDNYKMAFLYTGQHYSYNMKGMFKEELDIEFDHDLNCGSADVFVLKDNITKCFRECLNPSYVIVYGDTNSTLAAALAAKQVGSKLIHIEAGLRSFDSNMVEERNRIRIDSMSDYLLAPTVLNRTFLEYENITNNVFVTGNLIVDVCRKFSKNAILKGDYPARYLLLTLHRAESVDDPRTLRLLAKYIAEINYDVIFPVHPRTRNNLMKHNIQMPKNLKMIDPVGYADFIALLQNCWVVLTDSGGVQEEAVILRKPCITLRTSTERQETLLIRANRLFPLLGNDNFRSLNDVIEEASGTNITINPYGENVTHNVLDKLYNIIDHGLGAKQILSQRYS